MIRTLLTAIVLIAELLSRNSYPAKQQYVARKNSCKLRYYPFMMSLFIERYPTVSPWSYPLMTSRQVSDINCGGGLMKKLYTATLLCSLFSIGLAAQVSRGSLVVTGSYQPAVSLAS